MRSSFFILAGATLSLSLSGCAEDLELKKGVPTNEVQRCAVSGGTIQSRGRLGMPMCVHPYSDAGRSCSDKSDCRGLCLADRIDGELPGAGEAATGHCQPDDKLFGCYARVENGKALGGMCVD